MLFKICGLFRASFDEVQASSGLFTDLVYLSVSADISGLDLNDDIF